MRCHYIGELHNFAILNSQIVETFQTKFDSFKKYLIIIGRNGDFEDYTIFEGDFEQFILDNAPLVFMNPNADPFLCGNNGGPTSKCGHYVSEYAENWRVYKP